MSSCSVCKQNVNGTLCCTVQENAFHGAYLHCSRLWLKNPTVSHIIVCWMLGVCQLIAMTTLCPLTRLETRTKESNICVSSWVGKLIDIMKASAGILALASDQVTVKGLS